MTNSKTRREPLIKRADWTRSTRPDLVLVGEDLIGVAEMRSGAQGEVATLSITRVASNGELNLIALIHEPASGSFQQRIAVIERQWPHIVEMLQSVKGALDFKFAQEAFTQDQISLIAIAHLETALQTSKALQDLTAENVVLETAMLWRLLKQFGSFRPAEVIGEVTGVKPRTINARLKLARERGILPEVSRESSKRRTT
jgi:hypothetical protein